MERERLTKDSKGTGDSKGTDIKEGEEFSRSIQKLILESRIPKIEQKNIILGEVQGENFPGLKLCRRDSRNKTLGHHHLQSPLEYSRWKHAVERWKMTQVSWLKFSRKKWICYWGHLCDGSQKNKTETRLKGRHHLCPVRFTAKVPAAVSVEMKSGDTARWKSRAWRALQSCRSGCRIRPVWREPASACIHWVSVCAAQTWLFGWFIWSFGRINCWWKKPTSFNCPIWCVWLF